MFKHLLQSYSFSVSSNKGFFDTMNDIDPDGTIFISFFVYLIVVLVVLLFVLAWLAKRKNDLLGKGDLQTCTQISVTAKVISKRDFQPSKNLTADTFSHIVFECDDGQRLDFAFKPNDAKYHSIVTGDTGALTYAGKAFVDFQRIV